MTKPLIAIPAMSSNKVNGLRFAGSAVANAVLDRIIAAGGQPLIIYPGDDFNRWDIIDGIVVPGGADIDPARYSQRVESPEVSIAEDNRQDDADARFIKAAEEFGIPTLLICRAMQLWNVERGGTLIQHLSSDDINHVGSIHETTFEPGTRIREIIGDLPSYQVSSYHHQSVDALGDGLIATGRSADGCIEAVEDPKFPNILAVQWHPEDEGVDEATSSKLFEWLVEAARSCPVVGIVAQHNISSWPADLNGWLQTLTASAASELRAAGARVHIVDVTADQEPDMTRLASSDGVVIMGGGDVDPARYGITEPTPHLGGVDQPSDERQLNIVRQAMELDQPLLGICRGSQVLNVAFGGTLIPHIESELQHQGGDSYPFFIDEEVELEPGSFPSTVLDKTKVAVRGGHHQSVDELGPGLTVIARTADGIVEGTRSLKHRWIVGLQWHPEDPDGDEEDRVAIFTELVRQAAHSGKRA